MQCLRFFLRTVIRHHKWKHACCETNFQKSFFRLVHRTCAFAYIRYFKNRKQMCQYFQKHPVLYRIYASRPCKALKKLGTKPKQKCRFSDGIPSQLGSKMTVWTLIERLGFKRVTKEKRQALRNHNILICFSFKFQSILYQPMNTRAGSYSDLRTSCAVGSTPVSVSERRPAHVSSRARLRFPLLRSSSPHAALRPGP